MKGTEWRQQAACKPSDAWLFTTDNRPNTTTLNALTAICADCPVTADCAHEGLKAGSGFYAGLYLPSCGAGRPVARRQLIRKANTSS